MLTTSLATEYRKRMSELARVTQLYQSNLATLKALQTQLSSLESNIDTSDTYREVIKENKELMEKRSELNQRIIEIQLMQGEVHVPLPQETSPAPGIVFPLKRACDINQSESEPSPKLDKREISEKSKPQKIAEGKLETDRTIGIEKVKGAHRPKGTEKAKGAERAKGAPKAPEEDIPDISKMDFRIGRVLEVIHNKLTNIYIRRTRLVRTWVKTYSG